MHALLLHDEKVKVYKNIFQFVSLFKNMQVIRIESQYRKK